MSEPRQIYRFERIDTGEIVEVAMTLGELFERQGVCGRITLDGGVEATRVFDEFPTAEPVKRTGDSPWRNHESRSMGVHPTQVEHFRAEYKRRGCTGVEVLPNGNIKVGSSRAQKAYAKSRGLANLDSNS